MSTKSKSKPEREGLAALNGFVRFLVFAFLLFGGVLYGSAECQEMFEEFGIELPVATEILFTTAKQIRRYWFLVTPLVIGLWIGIELIVFAIPRDKGRLIVNIMIWLVLILMTAFVTAALLLPYLAIRSGLST